MKSVIIRSVLFGAVAIFFALQSINITRSQAVPGAGLMPALVGLAIAVLGLLAYWLVTRQPGAGSAPKSLNWLLLALLVALGAAGYAVTA